MRLSVVFASFVAASSVVVPALAGQSHYLLARAFDQFVATSSVSPPDLTTSVSATHQLGVGGVSPGFIANSARVDSDSGILAFTAKAARPIGDTSDVEPKNWGLASRLEQHVSPATSAPASMRVQLALTTSASVTHVKPITAKLTATLAVDGCHVLVTQTFMEAVPATLDIVDNCTNKVGFTASAGAGAITIDVANVRKAANIDAQVDAVFNYADAFRGELDVVMTGNITATPLAGSMLTFTSPTFGSGAPGVDAGTLPPADSGTPAAGNDASPSPNPSPSGDDAGTNNSLGAAPDAGSAGGSSDDSGCSVGALPRASSGAGAGLGLALAAATFAFIRRARRRML